MSIKSKKISAIIIVMLSSFIMCSCKIVYSGSKEQVITSNADINTVKVEVENIEDNTVKQQEKPINLDETTNIAYEDNIFKIYTPDNKNKNGLIRIEYKSIDFGIVLITKKGSYNTYKYIIYDNEPIDILITDGNGEYEIIAHSVTPTTSGNESIVASTEEINYYLNCEELELFKLSSSLVNYNDIEEFLKDKFNEIVNNYEKESNITLNKETKNINIVLAIFNYFAEFEYDIELANKISSGEITKHIVNVKDTIESKKGICIDSASALAALLRVNGYPTKLVYGYHNNSNQYHSWIEVYVDNKWYTLDSIMYKDGIVVNVSNYKIDKIH